MPIRPTNPSFMNGVPEMLILHLLRSREMYGYELVRAVREATGEHISLGEGVVYPVLHALERDRCLRSRLTDAPSGRSRVYYQLTARGRRRLETVTGDWARITRAIRMAIGRPEGSTEGGDGAVAAI
jgi:PadR family transcriptional regulator, regulatory protein PadR